MRGQDMHRFELVLTVGGHERERFTVGSKALVIGRAPDADVVLADMLVSRHHARVQVESNAIRVEDLGSRNGLEVNGEPAQVARVTDGDQLRIGEYVFRIERIPEFGQRRTTSLIPREQAGALQDRIISEATGRSSVLYRAAKLMGTVFDQDELLQQLLELCFDCLPARRGFVLTLDEPDGEAVVHASILLDDKDSSIPLSNTLIDYVFEHEASILTLNALEDERFQHSDSIIAKHIESAMCAPLCGRHESIVGAIYLDGGCEPVTFSQDQLELLTALGRVVGVAVENARLYRESVRRERLAAIGEATAGLGHCVKNILQGIKSGGEYIALGLEQNSLEWVQKGWPLVKSSADRIEGLMQNLLTISRDRSPELTPNDLNGICLEVVTMLRPRAEGSKVSVDFRPGQMGTVFCDGREIFRVVLNLVTNAIDACEACGKGEVIVTTYRKPSGVYVLIKDDGQGLSPEVRDRLFQAFVSTKGSGGIGLGLACSHKIAREHGGDIHIESAPGKGTRVTLFLPSVTAIGGPPRPVSAARGAG